MDVPVESRVTVKLFIGFLLNIDLKIQLNRSIDWKHALIEQDHEKRLLEFVHYEEEDFIGEYMEHSLLTMRDVKEKAANVREKLKIYVPEFDMDVFKVHVFPQVFVS